MFDYLFCPNLSHQEWTGMCFAKSVGVSKKSNFNLLTLKITCCILFIMSVFFCHGCCFCIVNKAEDRYRSINPSQLFFGFKRVLVCCLKKNNNPQKATRSG